uniref:Uncharacterized protein n=1 Tax=Tanacetum cinerariifolium TaxID=118510 RepID=A0A6L2K2E6_TANCI|nr:hypothetical protein [Tanacetum cinerariifolium]GEX41457.1 hypothetical protein [Tanacetum cinerariifolium]
MVRTNINQFKPPTTQLNIDVVSLILLHVKMIKKMNNKSQQKKKLRTKKDKLNDAPVFVDVVKLKGKKVVEKLLSSKKAKQVEVETELVPVDNDAHVFANEEEAETVDRNTKKINDTPHKVIKKVAGGNKKKKDVNEGNKVVGKLVSSKKVKQVADVSTDEEEAKIVERNKKDK